MKIMALNKRRGGGRAALRPHLPLLWALLAVSFALGCKKHAPEVSAPTTPSELPTPAGPSPHGPAPALNNPTPTVVAADADINTTLNQLSLELRRYVVRTHNVPKNFDDFIAKSQVQPP